MPNAIRTQAPLPVLLSASAPDAVAGSLEAERVGEFVTAIVGALLDAGMHPVFGGHPTVTPLVHRAACARGPGRPPISLFQLERFRDQAPPETADSTVFERVLWIGDPKADLATDLVNLREPMMELAEAAIFVGGKTDGLGGTQPGVRDEFERFRARHPEGPVYLAGGAGGETARMIADADGGDWERNGLQGEARHVLHASHDAHIVAEVIVRDLERIRQALPA
jgi:hypothetical protein